jgi:hypothetical protein
MFVEPLGGRRYVSVFRRRTRKDWAREVKTIVRERYPDAETVVLAMDNLNTHTVPAVYDGFAARIRACVARPGLQKCGGVLAWE